MAFNMVNNIESSHDSIMLDQSVNINEHSKNDPKYFETKKIENLQTLLDNDSLLFLLNLCLGIKD